jgi:hypothetical protein
MSLEADKYAPFRKNGIVEYWCYLSILKDILTFTWYSETSPLAM